MSIKKGVIISRDDVRQVVSIKFGSKTATATYQHCYKVAGGHTCFLLPGVSVTFSIGASLLHPLVDVELANPVELPVRERSVVMSFADEGISVSHPCLVRTAVRPCGCPISIKSVNFNSPEENSQHTRSKLNPHLTRIGDVVEHGVAYRGGRFTAVNIDLLPSAPYEPKFYTYPIQYTPEVVTPLGLRSPSDLLTGSSK